MAAVAGPSWMLMLLLLSGTPLNLPLSLPPLPEDAAIQRMAPQQCLWYLSLAGIDKANAKSKNTVEQLLAEDDVQQFVHDVSKQIKSAFSAAAQQDPVKKTLGEEGPKLVETLLTRPMCVYLGNVAPGPNGPVIRGGMAVNLGDDVAATKASLEKIEQALLSATNQKLDVDADGWHALPLLPAAPPVRWGIQDKYLLIGVGEGEVQQLNDRRHNAKAPPDWLTQLLKNLNVQRPAMVHYINVQTIVALVQLPMAGVLGMEQSQNLLMGLGVKNVKYYASVNGLDQEEFVSRALAATDGEPTGLLSMVGGEPLTPQSLVTIPDDASFAVAARVDPEKMLETFINLAAILDPQAPVELDQSIAQLTQLTGVHLKDDIFDALGDTWCLYNSPGDGGLVVTGLTLTVTLRDRDKLVQANDRLVAVSRQMMEQDHRQGADATSIREVEFAGQHLFFLNFMSPDSPVSPAWCITDKQLIVSLYPQMIKSYLQRQGNPASGTKPSKTLADVPAVAQMFAGGNKPTIISYQDTPNLFKVAYPLIQLGAQFAFSALQSEGIDVHIGMWPNARAIGPHLVATTDTVQSTKDGIRIESHGSMPMGIGTLPMVLLPVGWFALRADQVQFGQVNVGVPAGMVEQNASQENLRRIAQAALSFEENCNTLPAAFAASKDGKPLLSWRVAILPFIGEEDLASQFKLDEPWDSENNKKLIERMPEVFKAPSSKASSEFKTVYLSVRGDKTAFPGAKPVKLRSVTDGVAQTILMVETSDDKAVVWTKPDDFEADDKNPIAGLVGLRDGVFLAAFCDGHVDTIPADVDPDELKALFTRNGDEKVDASNLKRKPHQP